MKTYITSIIIFVLLLLFYKTTCLYTMENYPFENTGDQPIGSIGDIYEFPYQITKTYNDTVEEEQPFPFPENGQRFLLPNYVLTFCKGAKKSIVKYYRIENRPPLGEPNYNDPAPKEGDTFTIPGYIFTYVPTVQSNRSYFLKESFSGKQFFRWTVYRNSMCSSPTSNPILFGSGFPPNLAQTGCKYTNNGEQCGLRTENVLLDDITTDNSGKIISGEDSKPICTSNEYGGFVANGNWKALYGTNKDSNFLLKTSLFKVRNQGIPIAVRLQSERTYNGGLFMFDIAHMPVGMVTWGTIRLVSTQSEMSLNIVDIFNFSTNRNVSSLNTNNKFCTQTGSDGSVIHCADELFGCNKSGPLESGGTAFNKAGGGMFICEWTTGNLAKIWFLSYQSYIYNKVKQASNINIFDLSNPYVVYTSCTQDSNMNFRIEIDTNFCRDPSQKEYCMNYLSTSPIEELKESYWEIREIRTYG